MRFRLRMEREYETNEMERNKRKRALFRLFRSISFVSYSLFSTYNYFIPASVPFLKVKVLA
jgi:hypothetical protein